MNQRERADLDRHITRDDDDGRYAGPAAALATPISDQLLKRATTLCEEVCVLKQRAEVIASRLLGETPAMVFDEPMPPRGYAGQMGEIDHMLGVVAAHGRVLSACLDRLASL